MSANRPGLTRTSVNLLLLLACIFFLLLAEALRRRLTPKRTFAVQNQKAPADQPPADSNRPPQQTAPKQKKALRPTHDHPAFSERIDERQRMVARHIQDPFYSKAITEPNVLAAMKTVPRHAFVLPGDLRRAYNDHPLHIGFGQTISQPYIVAYMTEVLKLQPGCKILEIGTGSGYQAAVCAEIAQQVFTIEIIKELAESAEARLKKLGYRNVSVKPGDGYFGWPKQAPFDAIIVTAAAGLVPPPLVKQLRPGGKMILPLGSPFGAQTLVLITKDEKGDVRSQTLLPVRFVPMLGRVTETKNKKLKN